MDIASQAKDITARRKAAGVKQVEFCAQLGIDTSTWARWAQGKCKPRADVWEKAKEIAETFPEIAA